MSQVKDLFREHTHVDGDYFLMEILKVLGVVEDEDLSPPHHNTRTLFLDKMGKTIGSCNITEDCLEIKRIKQAEQIEEIRAYLSGGADHICAVVQCETDCDEELVNVALEKESGTLFIFSAFFCTRHKVAFARYPQALAMYVRDSKIRGVDPKCIK